MPDSNAPSGNVPISEKKEKWDFILKVVTTVSVIFGSISVIFGAIWGSMQYFEKKDQEMAERKRSYEFALYKERKETLYPLCNAAAEIVTSPSLKEAEKSIKTFETIYFGELGIVVNGEVAEAVKSFFDSLLEYKNQSPETSPPFDLIEQSSNLAIKCKLVLNLEKVYGITASK